MIKINDYDLEKICGGVSPKKTDLNQLRKRDLTLDEIEGLFATISPPPVELKKEILRGALIGTSIGLILEIWIDNHFFNYANEETLVSPALYGVFSSVGAFYGALIGLACGKGWL